MNLLDLGRTAVSDLRVDVAGQRAVAEATGLSVAAVRSRLKRAHGRRLVRSAFGDRWVSRLDELGDARVGQISDGLIEELARALDAPLIGVRREMGTAQPRTKVKTVLASRWPKLAALSTEQLLSRSLADLRRVGSIRDLAEKLSVDPAALRRRLKMAHGRSDAGSSLADLLPPTKPKPSPELVCGRFAVHGTPMKGGMGVVREAIDRVMVPPRKVVLKWARSDSPHFAKALEKELERAKDLAHPGLVKYFGEFRDEKGTPFLELEHGGVDLRVTLQKEGPMAWQDALVLVRQVAAALDYLHGRRLVHLDVSPANIVIDDLGRARLTDFGISRRVRQETGSSHLTSTVMNWHEIFSAPELKKNFDGDESADQYSLALVFLACVHGYEALHDACLEGERAKLHRGDRYAAVKKALSLKPKDRFRSAGEFVDTLASEGGSAGWFQKFLHTVLD
jgi:Protein kinase domain